MRVELRQEEEVLASRETPQESSLSEMVRELISEGEDGDAILFTGGSRLYRTIGHLVLLGCLYQYYRVSLSCCMVMSV